MFMMRRIEGTSMLPTFRPGKLVVGLTYRRPRLGDIVIAKQNGREVIKRVANVGERGFYLLGDNPASSTDSRHHGWLAPSAIESVVIGQRRR